MLKIDATAMATGYFDKVRKRALDDLVAMFTEDARLILHTGVCLQGRGAIQDFYRSVFMSEAPSPQLINTVGTGLQVATQMCVHLPDGSIRPAADFFSLTAEGLIETLQIYVAEPLKA